MFSRKTSHTEEESMTNKGLKKMDTVVTGIILGGIIASIYGIKKRQIKNAENHTEPKEEKITAPKQSIISRIFLGDRE